MKFDVTVTASDLTSIVHAVYANISAKIKSCEGSIERLDREKQPFDALSWTPEEYAVVMQRVAHDIAILERDLSSYNRAKASIQPLLATCDCVPTASLHIDNQLWSIILDWIGDKDT